MKKTIMYTGKYRFGGSLISWVLCACFQVSVHLAELVFEVAELTTRERHFFLFLLPFAANRMLRECVCSNVFLAKRTVHPLVTVSRSSFGWWLALLMWNNVACLLSFCF